MPARKKQAKAEQGIHAKSSLVCLGGRSVGRPAFPGSKFQSHPAVPPARLIELASSPLGHGDVWRLSSNFSCSGELDPIRLRALTVRTEWRGRDIPP